MGYEAPWAGGASVEGQDDSIAVVGDDQLSVEDRRDREDERQVDLLRVRERRHLMNAEFFKDIRTYHIDAAP